MDLLLSVVSTSPSFPLPRYLNPSLAQSSVLQGRMCERERSPGVQLCLPSMSDPAVHSAAPFGFGVLTTWSKALSQAHYGSSVRGCVVLRALGANIGCARPHERLNATRPFELQQICRRTLPMCVPTEQSDMNWHVTFTPDRARLAFM